MADGEALRLERRGLDLRRRQSQRRCGGSTPQLGGDLDANGFDIAFDDGTGIADDSGNGQLVFHKTAAAVNRIGIANAATGAAQLAAEGTDPNVDLRLAPKGAGIVRTAGPAVHVQRELPAMQGANGGQRGHKRYQFACLQFAAPTTYREYGRDRFGINQDFAIRG